MVGTSWTYRYGPNDDYGNNINFITEFDANLLDWHYENGEYVEDHIIQMNYVYNAPNGVLSFRDEYRKFTIDGNKMFIFEGEEVITYLKQ